MTEFKIFDVVLLTTDVESKIFLPSRGEKLYLNEQLDTSTPYQVAKHLYILSNEPIRVGDLYYTIGSTDTYGINLADTARLANIANEYKAKRVVGTTNQTWFVSKPTDAFISAWVDNPQDKIEVEWEYEPSRTFGITGDFTTREINRIKVYDNNLINCRLINQKEEKTYTQQELLYLMQRYGDYVSNNVLSTNTPIYKTSKEFLDIT